VGAANALSEVEGLFEGAPLAQGRAASPKRNAAMPTGGDFRGSGVECVDVACAMAIGGGLGVGWAAVPRECRRRAGFLGRAIGL